MSPFLAWRSSAFLSPHVPSSPWVHVAVSTASSSASGSASTTAIAYSPRPGRVIRAKSHRDASVVVAPPVCAISWSVVSSWPSFVTVCFASKPPSVRCHATTNGPDPGCLPSMRPLSAWRRRSSTAVEVCSAGRGPGPRRRCAGRPGSRTGSRGRPRPRRRRKAARPGDGSARRRRGRPALRIPPRTAPAASRRPGRRGLRAPGEQFAGESTGAHVAGRCAGGTPGQGPRPARSRFTNTCGKRLPCDPRAPR